MGYSSVVKNSRLQRRPDACLEESHGDLWSKATEVESSLGSLEDACRAVNPSSLEEGRVLEHAPVQDRSVVIV
jgi:hypothetical protein